MSRFLVSTRLALKSLRSNMGRTILSLLGIVIGIVVVVVVLSLGSGVREFVLGQVESFGTDLIEIEVRVPQTGKTSTQNAAGQVGGTQITTFTLEDAERVAQLENLGHWYAGILGQEVVTHDNRKDQTFLFGVTPGIADVDDNFDLTEGDVFSDEDARSQKQVVILGSAVKEEFFGERSTVGERIRIRGQSYRIVGVAKERGGAGFFNFDEVIYVPLQTLQKKIQGIDHIQFALFKLQNKALTEITILQAEDIMRDQHDIEDSAKDDFSVFSIEEAQGIVDSVFSALNLLLIGLTSISLLVGGVGIMNVMYVSVVERTSEIGLRKALGARKGDILGQFLVEAIILTGIGGMIGIAIGSMLVTVASLVITRMGFFIPLTITAEAIAISVVFSVATGLFFGLQPARKAGGVSPMEAIRSE